MIRQERIRLSCAESCRIAGIALRSKGGRREEATSMPGAGTDCPRHSARPVFLALKQMRQQCVRNDGIAQHHQFNRVQKSVGSRIFYQATFATALSAMIMSSGSSRSAIMTEHPFCCCSLYSLSSSAVSFGLRSVPEPADCSRLASIDLRYPHLTLKQMQRPCIPLLTGYEKCHHAISYCLRLILWRPYVLYPT